MEYESVEDLHDENSLEKEEIKDDGKHVPGAVPGSSGNNILVNMAGWERGGIAFESEPIPEETSGEINMEACITTDDVIRAGGFGARDDISSFLLLPAIQLTLKKQFLMRKIMKSLRKKNTDRVLAGKKQRMENSS